MHVESHICFGLFARYLFFVCGLSGARSNFDRHQRRRRAAATAGLRSAANFRAWLWVPGYWAWDDDTGYYWVPGTWVTPPEPELLWTPGYWGWDDVAYQFHDGYWGPQIGFYGGVAYGFGYTGDGYEGGYWRDGNFFYNQSVNNISNVSITNVYNRTVVVNNTSNVSYNGGTGGTAAKPTAEQIAAGKEHHVAATPEQTRHVEAAAKDPALSLNSNHGHPTVAATAHPALFTGPGIIRARPGKPIAAVTPEGHRKAIPSNPAALPGNKVGPATQRPVKAIRSSPASRQRLQRSNQPRQSARPRNARAQGQRRWRRNAWRGRYGQSRNQGA